MRTLQSRLETIPGVQSIIVDPDQGPSGGITVHIEVGADETEVLENVRRLLVAYGLHRRSPFPMIRSGSDTNAEHYDLSVTPGQGRVAVALARGTRSATRLTCKDPVAIAQAAADAWCQLSRRPPVEVISVSADDESLSVTVRIDEGVRTAEAELDSWRSALVTALGRALGNSEL